MKTVQLSKHILQTGKRSLIMGILNVTPDSFTDGGTFFNKDLAVKAALKMESEGADIIDIGGESSRPGSDRVSVQEELERVAPVVKALRDQIRVPISVDTYKSEVAYEVLSNGAAIINDITALSGDENMAKVIADFDAGVVLMHMKGNPKSMQDDPVYDDVVEDIKKYLVDAIECGTRAGIDPKKMIVDPGIGFGKTLEHNLTILKRLDELKSLSKLVMIGTSHKAFLGALTGRDVKDRGVGTAASVVCAITKGADIVRVHNVSAIHDAVCVVDALSS